MEKLDIRFNQYQIPGQAAVPMPDAEKEKLENELNKKYKELIPLMKPTSGYIAVHLGQDGKAETIRPVNCSLVVFDKMEEINARY